MKKRSLRLHSSQPLSIFAKIRQLFKKGILSLTPNSIITVCDRKCAEKMLLFEFKSKDISNPCYFHYQYLHCNSAGHHIKPNLSHMLRLCYRCCNSCNDYNCSSNTANQIRDADKREYSRCAASVNRVLNRLVSVPCRCKTAYRKSIYQKKQASPSPVVNV